MKRTIFVTGGAGYLGSVICQKLLDRGYIVKCYDNLFYGKKGIEHLLDHKNFKLIQANTVYIEKYREELEGCYAVIHLAELANDPSCDLEPEMTDMFSKTEIKYYLPETTTQASLLIFDMYGTQLRDIQVDTFGNGFVTIDGNDLAAGMYIYALIADGKEIDSKRMILTK